MSKEIKRQAGRIDSNRRDILRMLGAAGFVTGAGTGVAAAGPGNSGTSAGNGGTDEQPQRGRDLFVDPDDGSDNYQGNQPEPVGNGKNGNGPLKTVQAAIDRAEELASNDDRETVNVWFRGGRYKLDSTATIDSFDESVSANFQAYPDEQPVLDGGQQITGWEETTVNGMSAWSTTIPEVASGDWVFRQLYVDGRRRRRARSPTTGCYYEGDLRWNEGNRTIQINSDHIDDWDRLSDVELVVNREWNRNRLRIDSFTKSNGTATVVPKKPERTVAFEEFYPQRQSGQTYYFENAREFLSEPGEWYLNRKTGKLTYIPLSKENIDDAELVAPNQGRFLEVTDSSDIKFRNFTFENSNWSTVHKYGFVGRQASFMHGEPYLVPSAAYIEGSENIAFERNIFQNLGAGAIEVGHNTRETQIVGNVFQDLAGGGVTAYTRFSDDFPNRTDVFAAIYHGAEMPAADTVCQNGAIENNYFTRYAQDYAGCVAVNATFVRGYSVTNNTVWNAPYAGLSVGWGWSEMKTPLRDNTIHSNDIYDLFRFLCDGGGVYMNGRQDGTRVTENYIHDYSRSKWAGSFPISAVDMDGDASYMTVKDNVFSNTPLGVEAGTTDGPNTYENNVSSNPEIENRAGVTDEFANQQQDVRDPLDPPVFFAPENEKECRLDNPKQEGPVAAYSFDEPTPTDVSENGHDGVIKGDVATEQPGVVNQAYEFSYDGGGSFGGKVEVPGYLPVSGGISRSTVAWVKFDRTAAKAGLPQTIFFGGGNNGGRWIMAPYSIFTEEPYDRLTIDVKGGQVMGETRLGDDEWHHIAGVLPADGDQVSDVQLYVDGSPENVASVERGSIQVSTQEGLPLTIGRRTNQLIDEPKIYNRALSEQEVSDLYQKEK